MSVSPAHKFAGSVPKGGTLPSLSAVRWQQRRARSWQPFSWFTAGSRVNPAAEQPRTVVERENLAAREAALRFVEGHACAAAVLGEKF